MTTVLRNRLTYSALAAASSFIALAAPAHAQSVCLQTGTTFSCTNGGATGTVDATAIVGGTEGLVLTDTGNLNVTASGSITSSLPAPSPALIAFIPGSITLNAGTGGALNVTSTGTSAAAVLISNAGTLNATLGNLDAANSMGLLAVGANGANVTTGSITASNVTTALVPIPELGLTAGAGGSVTAPTAGDATLTTNGNVVVIGTTDPLVGVITRAPHGNATTIVNGSVNVTSVGRPVGAAAIGSTGATVQVTGQTSITGGSLGGAGLAALTNTGTATISCGSVVGVGNGMAGVTANGPVVSVNCGNITMTGTDNVGLDARASTSAMAKVGNVTVNGDGSTGILINDPLNFSGTVDLTAGNVAATGLGSVGVNLFGSDITARLGTVSTNADNGVGVLLNSSGPIAVLASGNTPVNITTLGSNADAFNATAGTTINATLGTISTKGANSAGVRLSAPGAITLTTGNITTAGATSPGVFVTGGAGNVSIATGTVTTTGATSNGIVASTTSGNLTVNSGKVTATGAGVFTRSGTGTQQITLAGAQTTGNSVDVATTGTGAITVTTTAPTYSTAGYGIRAAGTTGTVTVNAGAATGGVLGAIYASDSGAGTVNVNVTGTGLTSASAGDVIRVETLGTANTTIGAGVDIEALAGPYDGIDTRGTLANNVTVGGHIGANGSGYTINATGGRAAITVLGTGSLYGPINLATGTSDDLVTNGGQIYLFGTSNFGAGNDTLNNASFVSLNGATVTGLDTLNNSNSIDVVGANTLTGTTINNSAFVTAKAGTASLAGLAAFNNSGLIDLSDGAANDVLTLGGNYDGKGAATLRVDVDGALNTADKLVVGGNITGSTVIDVNLVGSTPLYNPTGVVVVDGGGTVPTSPTPPAFTLNPADRQYGFLNYALRQVGNDTYVASTLDSSVTDLAMLGSLGQELWYQSFDAYHDAIMGRHAGSLVSGHNIGIWGQLYESKDRYGDRAQTGTINLGAPGGATAITYSDRLRTHRRGAQVGLEFRGTGFVIGATGGYEWARREDDPAVARLKAEGHNYGAYALFGMASGLYGGLMIKRDDYHVNFGNDLRAVSFRNKAHSTGGDAEIGFRTNLSGPIAFDLNAGMSYVKTNIDAWNQYGLTFDWQNNKSWRGRLGARAIFPRAWGAFVGAKVFHEFKDDGFLAVRNGTVDVGDIDLAHRGTWARLEAGLDGSATSGALLTVWGDVGDTKSFGARVGFRF